MADLILSPSLKNMIIKHPASLTLPSTLGISPSTASIILEGGYAQGFKMIFVLNAALTAVATIISILMVRDHKPTGGDQQSYSLSIDSEKTVHAGETTRTTHIRVEMATDMMRQIPLHMTYPPSAKLESAQKDIC
jgi:hypothetical protein